MIVSVHKEQQRKKEIEVKRMHSPNKFEYKSENKYYSKKGWLLAFDLQVSAVYQSLQTG